MQPSFVEAGGRTVHVWRAGSGAAAVLLHGFSDDGACWTAVADTLTVAGRSVVAPDTPGHGRTPLPDGEPFTADRRAADTVGVIEALGIAPVLLVGHSMGALTALLVAAGHPHLVAGVVLEDPPLPDGRYDPIEDATNPLEPWIADLQALDEPALTTRCRAENPVWSDAEIEPWVASKLALDRRLFLAPHTWLGRPWRDAVEAVRCPLVLLTGEQALGAAVGAEARAWWRDTGRHLVEADGAGHNVRRERRDAFEAAVAAVVASC
jgi:pimeloyl-ACP methyl ester carboxylesterase